MRAGKSGSCKESTDGRLGRVPEPCCCRKLMPKGFARGRGGRFKDKAAAAGRRRAAQD